MKNVTAFGELPTALSLEERGDKEDPRPQSRQSNDVNISQHHLAAKSETLLIDEKAGNLLYGVNDSPPWYTCLMLGMQHFLLMVESTVSIPYLITPLMCMAHNDPYRGYITSTIIFASGLSTLLQTTLGVRLPIIQGGSHGFLGPVLAIISTSPCPSEEELLNLSDLEKENVWKSRMLTLQGSICVAALVQVIVGATGLVGVMKRWITPLTLTPTITLIGLSLFEITSEKASSNWWISSLTIFLLILFSQYFSKMAIPCVSISRDCKPSITSSVHIFQMFPVIFTLSISWFICFLLTTYEVLGENDPARTDLRLEMIHQSPWFFIPYPAQFGLPTPSLAGIIGISVGVIASVIESVGDYYACAKLAEAPPPPTHAFNRGIFIEGIGTFMSGWFGTGSGTTSFSQNVAAIGLTGIGSRRVVQYAGGIMILCGVLGKVGALFINIPEPIIGGIFVIVFSMITAVGLSSLQYVDLNSSRNLFVIGFSIFIGLTLPHWASDPENRDAINTPYPVLNQVCFVLLQIPMFIGGFFGFVLDNTIPGTDEERGLSAWENQHKKMEVTKEESDEVDDTYDLPFPFKNINKLSWTRHIPISPLFEGWNQLRLRKWSPSKSKINL